MSTYTSLAVSKDHDWHLPSMPEPTKAVLRMTYQTRYNWFQGPRHRAFGFCCSETSGGT